MSNVLIVGGAGNMGKRYAAILRYLGMNPIISDVGNDPLMEGQAHTVAAAIICTPTDTHAKVVTALASLGKPILCEKPLSKNLDEVRHMTEVSKYAPVTMVYQYSYLVRGNTAGWTYYNYFKHGNDGLAWDCIQIIGLAKGDPSLDEESPLWRCRINGESLDLAMMDAAYVHMVRQWMRYPNAQDPGMVRAMHEKTANKAKGLERVV